MYYRIAEITLLSQFCLPSFEVFTCEPAEPDVTLDLMVDIQIGEGEETRAGCGKVRRMEEGWFFHSVNSADYGLLANRDYTKLLLKTKENGRIVPYDEMVIRLALECLLIWRGYIPLHSACVELDGLAFIFTGPSNVGKSSRAAMWVSSMGAQLVSGDGPLIRAIDAEVFGVPWDAEECCYRNVQLQTAAICEVRRSFSVFARKLSFRQKMDLLTQRSFIPQWDMDTTAAQIVNISRLAHFEIVRVFCGPEAEDARLLRQILNDNQIKEEAIDMKAKQGFVLRNVMDEYILMPTGSNIDTFNGTVLLSEVSAFIWEQIQQPLTREDLLRAILDKYDVEEKKAAEDMDQLLEKLRSYGLIEKN